MMTKPPIKTEVVRLDESKTVEEAYRSIGKFVAYFSQLEEALRWIVAAELNILHDEMKEPLISLIDYTALCNAVRRLLLSLNPDKRPKDAVINTVIERCIVMGSQRNIVAHGSWDILKGTKHVNRQTLVPKLSFERPADLNKKTEDIWQLILAVFDLYVTFLPENGKGAILGA